jgi:glycosyltransferase involved in cell wall biosynthesis
MKSLLVIPAFNEEPTIAGIIKSAKAFLPDSLVVDDGSEDATTLVAAIAGAMVHRLKENRGKGAALKEAFKYALDAGYDRVITIDSDGQHDPADLANFLPLLEQYDLILGNRMGDRESVPPLRRAANLTSSFIISVLAGQRIHDSQTGFRAYSAELLRGVKLNSDRYDMESEVIIKAARKGFRIGDAKIRTIYADEVSRFRNVKDSARFLWVVLKSFFWW